MIFLTKYKMNPFELFKDITLLDFETYVRRIEMQLKEESKSKDGKKDLAKSLIAIRDILNYMTL